MKKFPLLLLLAALMFSPLFVIAQDGDSDDGETRRKRPERDEETPIQPSFNKTWPWSVGALIGASFNSQGGKFYSACDCEFTKGGGSGLILGVFAEKQFSKEFAWGLRLTHEAKDITAKFVEYEYVELENTNDGSSFEVPVRFRHEARTEISALALTPYLQYTPFKAMFFQAGFSGQYIYSANIVSEKQLAERTIRDPNNGQLLDIGLDGRGLTQTVEDGEIQDLNPFQMYASFMVGINIHFSEDFAFIPMFNFGIPFSTISERGEDFTISSGQLLFGFRKTL